MPRKVLIFCHQCRADSLLAVAGVDKHCSPDPVCHREEDCRNGARSYPVGKGPCWSDA